MKRYIILFLMVTLCSCVSQQKKIDHAYDLIRANNGKLAALCVEQFPIKDRFIQGKETIKTDTILLAGKILPCPPSIGQKTAFIRCPDAKTITKTIFKTDTIERENTALIVDLNNRLSTEQEQRKSAEITSDKYRRHFKISTWLSFISTSLLCLNAFLRWKFR